MEESKNHGLAVVLSSIFWKELWAYTLNRFGFRKFSTSELYLRWIHGQIGRDTLFMMLLPEQVDEFIAHHEKQKETLSLIARTPNGRQYWSRAMQLDNMIENDLEKSVLRERKKINVVRRAN